MTDAALKIHEGRGFCTLAIKVIPKSSRNKVMGMENGALKVKLTAPPVDGAANEALVDFLSKLFGKPKSSMELLKGQQSRHKLVRIKGLKAEDILEALVKLKN